MTTHPLRKGLVHREVVGEQCGSETGEEWGVVERNFRGWKDGSLHRPTQSFRPDGEHVVTSRGKGWLGRDTFLRVQKESYEETLRTR